MAGQRATLVEQMEDHHAPLNYSWMNAAITGKRYIPLFVAERDTVVESAIMRWTTADGSARLANLAYAANAVALSTNTNMTTAAIDINGTAATNNTFTFITNATAGTASSGAVPESNIVPAGSTCLLEFDGNTASVDGLVLSLRITTKKK